MMMRGRKGRLKRAVSMLSSGLLPLRIRRGKKMIVEGRVDIDCYGAGVYKVLAENAQR